MIRVLIVDDSALVRTELARILGGANGIEVVGTASDPFAARDKLKVLSPDVITLDIEMPRMDGLTFLEKLMAFRPTRVVMVSSLTQDGAAATLKALSLGAIDFVGKPAGTGLALEELEAEIIAKVRAAATAKLRPAGTLLAVERRISVDQVVSLRKPGVVRGGGPLVVIGASTGGTTALEEVLTQLPENVPPIAIVQHMPPGYTAAFASRLDGLSRIAVVEAHGRRPAKPGEAVIAAGGSHLLAQSAGGKYWFEVKQGPPVNRHCPSVDVLFRSAANSGGAGVLGILLTGMGDDGARGLHDLQQAGAETVAQDEASSVVYGMPRAAVELGAANRVASLSAVPGIIAAFGR